MSRRITKKASSAKLAALASKVLHGGYWPTKAETKALAASVLAQSEKR